MKEENLDTSAHDDACRAGGVNPFASPQSEEAAASSDLGLALGEATSVAYETTPEDIIAAGVFEWDHLKGARLRRFRMLLMLVWCILFLPTFVHLFVHPDAYVAVALTVFAFFSWLLFGLAASRRRKMRRLVLRVCQRATQLLGPVRLSIGPQGMEIIEGTDKTHHPWRRIDAVAAIASHAFAIRGTGILCRIPRRAFASVADFRQFVRLMQSQLVAAKKRG